ncbi:MAG: hypothetical protein FWD05_12725 [Oscillospiraceae bacterium]|nr:hypothetical protein [Oscillospiraceae bacterium]
MIWIKANKTKLYRLISKYIILPKMKYTNFYESDDRNGYNLEWCAGCGTQYRACYLFINNLPRLVIQCKEKQSKAFVNHTICTLSIEELVEREMIKGVRCKSQIRKKLLLQQQDGYSFDKEEYVAFS